MSARPIATPTKHAPTHPPARVEVRPDRARTGEHAGERRIIILGSTGSIGTQTLQVVEHLNALHAQGEWPVRFRVVGLATGRNSDAMAAQAAAFGVRDVAVATGHAEVGGSLKVRRGASAAEALVREVEADIVLGAMVGAAGLPATLAAVEMGIDVALANKETLVAAGALVVPAAQRSGARLLPVDSEHGAVWQCLQGAGHRALGTGEEGSAACPPMRCGAEVARVILTASGGPFRSWTKEQIETASPAAALKHPTWTMGPKVTIDSASLTNKALEVIEAHWLFGLEGSRIGVLVHPQSIVHSIVEWADGSMIAQLGPADMRSPIQYALTFPRRPEGASRKLDWTGLSKLEFEPPDLGRFPALGLAYRCIELGGTAGAVFNAANEAAVEAFLEPGSSLPFGRIPALAKGALEAIGASPLRDLNDVLEADAAARVFVRRALGGRG